MKKRIAFLLLLMISIDTFSQIKSEKADYKLLKEKIEKMEYENQNLHNKYDNLATQYQQTNDRLNNYLTYTANISAAFGILIAIAGIYIGFESLRSQNRRKEAIKTLEDAKNYVNDKKTEFDNLIEEKKNLLQREYNKIIEILKEKLLSDIELETSKVKGIVEKKSEEIQKYSIEQQHNKTIELLEQRLEFFESVGIPDDPEILLSKAKILREKKKHNEAILLLERVIEIDPSYTEAFWFLGYEYAEIKDNINSIKNYKKSIEIKPNDSSAYNNVALRYKASDDLISALENLNKAIELSDKKELYYSNRIDVLMKLGSIDRAIGDYVRLISLNPDKKDYYSELIKLFRKEGRLSDVLTYFDKAIAHFSDETPEISHEIQLSKASFLGEMGKKQEAIDILQKLIDNDYKIENCYIKIAELKSELGKREEAIRILDNGILKNPLSSTLYIHKAFIESSVDVVRSKLTIDKGGELINTESYFFLGGRFFNQRNKFELAQYCYEQSFQIVEGKLSGSSNEEIDMMNFYEMCIILNKPLQRFDDDYRDLVISEKYTMVLTVIDILSSLFTKFDKEGKDSAVLKIKNLHLEAKEIIDWNFGDIQGFIDKTMDKDFSLFAGQVFKYIRKEIKFEDL